MQLVKLNIESFKSIEKLSCEFNDKFNAFTGHNGIGKTNVLDAIYYLCTGKSYFNSNDTQLIRNEEQYFSLKGSFEKVKDETDEILCVLIRGRKKVIKKNDVQYERMIDHYGAYPAIMIAPNDIDLIMGGSEERRKWMDSTISMHDREYLMSLIQYDKALQQRNAELKNMYHENGFNRGVLELYDKLLISLAHSIFEKRKEFIREFIPVFSTIYDSISGKHEPVGVTYQSQLLEGTMEHFLEFKFRQDLAMQRTTHGTHKDDLEFTIYAQPAKKFASQGQQKSFIFSMRLAQYKYFLSKSPIMPLLLLDDVCERLDESRLQNLMKILSQKEFGQIFITDTSPERLKKIIPFKGEGLKILEME